MKYPFFSQKFFKRALMLILSFCALSALAGSLALIFTNGLGMAQDFISGVFPSYLIPGLVLFFIVGGTNLLAIIVLKKKWLYAVEACATAGFGLQIWIFVEMYIIQQSDALQIVYFSAGTLILILTFLYQRKEGEELHP